MKNKSNVPMSRPEAALAIHNTKCGYNITWAQLDSNRIILNTSSGFAYSDDCGMSWSEPYEGKHASGESVSAGGSLVSLGRGVMGMTFVAGKPPSSSSGRRLYFCKSTDEGHTWSAPVLINPEQSAVALSDVLLQTTCGRLIYPVYSAIGQTAGVSFRHEQAPWVGGYVNGNFVTTDAHFYDPHFGFSRVYYSDDQGETWQTNEDGELFIIRNHDGSYHMAVEPTVCEVEPGKLLMMVRTRLGRLFQAWSHNNGQTWTRLEPTQLAASPAPAQLRRLSNGHLLCVFTQQSREEIMKGFVRTRLSSAVSRNGGGLWEHFQNIESLHEETHVEPGPIEETRPAGGYRMCAGAAFENDRQYVVPLPVGYGRWSYPSVLVLADRVLVTHSFSYYDETGNRAKIGYRSKMKVLPTSWFYSGLEPNTPSECLSKYGAAPKP